MRGKVACLILNRNLREVTDRLCEHILRFDPDGTDVFVIEAGSIPSRQSTYARWIADWPEAVEHGLRYARGMNFGLAEMWKSSEFQNYEYFFLVTNDTEFEDVPTISRLVEVAEEHPRVGILSPCSRRWGERHLLSTTETRYFWFIHNNAHFIRREFLDDVMNTSEPNPLNFVFDGTNFRGYGLESEMIAKAYANDWAAAITTRAWAKENESHLLTQADLIRTEPYETNLKLYLEEGREWMRRKYGFNSRWSMQIYTKAFYDKFFEVHPEYFRFKI